MGLRDCLISAAEQGVLTRQEAAELADDFEQRHAQLAADMGDAAALAEAKARLAAELRATAAEKKRRADLTEAARLSVLGRVQAEGDAFRAAKAILSHYGFRDGSSVRGRAEAIISLAHGKLAEVMANFSRSGVLGRRINAAAIPDLAKELHGENSGDATAKALARAISGVFEDLRQRFNAAGGAIGKLDGFGLPHSHDRFKVKAMGRDGWKDFIRPRLDPARMTDALTGRPIDPARLDAALDHAFENIVTEGRAHMTPQMRPAGLGAIAGRRMDERFFTFKDAASWLDYHKAMGRGDVIEAIFHHVTAMAKDIAAMELLGPNPGAMVEWMKQVVERETGRMEVGLPALSKPGVMAASQAKAHSAYLGWLWESIRGRAVVSSGWANTTANIKNLATSATLGATGILAAATDPFISRAARKLAGLPVTKTMGDMIATLRRAGHDEIVASGVIAEEFLHVMGDELRFAGPVLGSNWSKWIADRAVTWNGLQPITKARKLVEARAWQKHVGDLARAGTGFDRLDPVLKRTLEGFGVDRTVWDIWKQGVDPNGFVTPMAIENAGGGVAYLDMSALPLLDPARLAEERALAHRAAAEKLAELTASWSERSVPVGTPNARAVFSAGAARGTIPGELLDYFLQFKSFGLSFTTLQIEALTQTATAGKSGLGYFAGLAVPLTLGGGLYLQIRAMLDGRDPEDMTTPAFWERAILTGGGFGLFGDFFRATENRFGQSMQEALAGPGLAWLSDSFKTARALALGSDKEKGRATVNWLGRWTPVASSHPATRAAWRRLFLDNLQWATDPEADKSFKAKMRSAKAAGSPYFLPPGTFTPLATPRRAPDLAGAVTGRN